MIPDIKTSTKEERQAYVEETYRCKSDCDSCGICSAFSGKEPMIALEDYIEGKRTIGQIMTALREGR